jgi:hypothetical protein
VTTVLSNFPPSRPLIRGTEDGIVRPARMIAFAFGARVGAQVWVTGSDAEDGAGALYEWLEGDVFLVDQDPLEDSQQIEDPVVDPVAVEGRPGLPRQALAGADRPDTVGYEAAGEAGSALVQDPVAVAPFETAAGVAAAGYTREALEGMGWQEVRAAANELGVTVVAQGRPSKAALIDGILAKQEG